MPESKRTRSRRAAAPKQPQLSQPSTFQPCEDPVFRQGDDPSAYFKAKEAARIARLAPALDLKNLDEAERAFLAVCQKIHRRHSGGTGHTSPFEQFFSSLVYWVGEGKWPTPYSMDFSLASFRADFDDMRRNSVLFLEAYPPASPAPEMAEPTAKPSKKAKRSRQPRTKAKG